MFDSAFINELKQTNISLDGEKTKERVKSLWATASSSDRQAIENLAGVARATVYRVYNTGSISAKLTVAIAQTLNVNPYFLTGSADEQGECSDELLEDILKEYGYEKKVAVEKRKQRRKPPSLPELDSSPDKLQKTADDLSGQFDREMRKTLQSAAEEYKREFPFIPAQVVPELEQSAPVSDDTRAFLDSLREDDMILLLRAILMRAKSGISGTAELADKLKLLLLS